MTLIYHANRAYLYCDPADDRMALVDKDDYDDRCLIAREQEDAHIAANLRNTHLVERIRALEADVADVAKINVDLMKRNRELEARIERVRTVANTSGVRSEDMFDAVYSLLADAPQTETKGEQG